MHPLPTLVLLGWLALLLMALAYCIESLRYRWLSFEELPAKEQERLLAEAERTAARIGGRVYHADPRVVSYPPPKDAGL